MLTVLTNTLAFIFALGVIIFVHEAGHLLMAKFFDMRVATFSLGFGKRIWGFRRGGTDYRLSLIPLGGYVQLSGEDPGEVGDDPGEFLNRPRWQRVFVYLAGPAMNVVLAVLLVAFVFMLGIEVAAPPDIPAVIGSVRPESPAAEAGLQADDLIVAIDGKPLSRWEEARFAFLTAPERSLQVEYEREGQRRETIVTPIKVPKYEFGDAGAFPKLLPRIAGLFRGEPAEAAGFEVGDLVRSVDGQPIASQGQFIEYVSQHAGESVIVEVLRDDEPVELFVVPRSESGRGWIGVSLTVTSFQRFGAGEALIQSVRFNWDVTRQTFAVIGKIFSGQLAAKSALSGPIQIAALSGAAARSGFRNLLHLMGLISISIAILNLLPIPVLDGGQIAILLVESLFRRDLSLTIKERINQVGFLLIVMLMVMVLYFDLVKVIPEGVLPGS
ncbi:MAG: RIP metalloprotease RseP [Acidobacteriota bacterium]|nr:RIP metalloprotease RseP [Acidobacteriota bacterium]